MRIKELREEKGLTQRQVAEACGVTAATILNWENGIYEPGTTDLINLSKVLGASLDYIVGLDEPHEEEIIRRYLSRLDKEKLIEILLESTK